MSPVGRVAIVEGDFVVGAWHIRASVEGIPCTCGKCDAQPKQVSRTLILCRRDRDYYTLDLRSSGSQVNTLDVEGEGSDEAVFEAMDEELTTAISDAFADGGELQIKGLRVFTSDPAEIQKKLDVFMGVSIRRTRLPLDGGAA